MKKLTLALLGAIMSLSLSGQSFNVPFSGSDSTSLCNGTLFDHAGPTGNYSNGANGTFYLDVPGNTLSITFTSFQLESCCDYVRVYDGIGTSGTALVFANGTSLPNSGNPITVPSGKATIVFTSDGSVTYSGFALTWSGGGTTAPVAQFSVSNPNPPVNVGVSFINNSVNGGSAYWDFGDGTSSTDISPVHSYTSPGTYTARLIATNCYGTDTSSNQSITVMANPLYNATPDSLYASVNCGNTATQSFVINQTGGGTMYYDVEGREAGANPNIFEEGFESGLGNFSVSPSAFSGFNYFVALGGAAVGNSRLVLTGASGLFTGLYSNFTPSQPTGFSYHVKPNGSSERFGHVCLGDGHTGSANRLFFAQVYNSTLYVYSQGVTQSYTINTGQWNHIELKNIDWNSKTFDIEVNGVTVGTGLGFNNNNTTQVSTLNVYNGGNYNYSYDDFKVKGAVTNSNITLFPSSGVLSSGNSNTISTSISTAGLSAGRYEYEVVLKTNASTTDSVKTIPFTLDVTGSAILNMSKTCMNFGQVYTGQTYHDSVMITNSGCDSLDISSITATNADFVPSVSSLMIPPYDTAYLHLNFNPSSIQNYTDTIHLVNNDSDTAICLSANAVGVPVITTDSASYQVVSAGCNDSIPFSFEIINTGQSNLVWDITSNGGSVQNADDFESGNFGSLWQSTGTNLVTTTCVTGAGSYGVAMNGSVRDLRTVPINVGPNDSIKFYHSPGNNSGSYCELPNGSEDVYLEYSLNGITWTQIAVLYNNSTAGFKRYAVPAGAVSPTTRFRFYQSQYSSSTIDNHILDEVEIGSSIGGNFNPSSGTTTASDTTTISGYIDVSGKNSGTYSQTVTIRSNDPSDSVYTFTVDVIVNGNAAIEVPVSCMAFGTVMTGAVAVDSFPVLNSGCDDLMLSGATTSNTDLTATLGNITSVAPGDTGWVHVSFSPTSITAYSDTVYVQSNDTTKGYCITGTGVGAPTAVVTPDSLYASFSSCNDSITIPVKIKNSGVAGLDYLIKGGSGKKVNVLLYGYSRTSFEYQNVKTLLQQMPGINLTESLTYIGSVLTNELSNTDVLIIPKGSYLDYSLVTPIQNFVTNGGTYIHLAEYWGGYSRIGILPITGNYLLNSWNTVNNEDMSHPITKDAGPTLDINSNTQEFIFNNTASNYTVQARQSNSLSDRAVIATMPYGSGTAVLLGYDYYAYTPETETVLVNAVKWNQGTVLADFITLSQDSGVVITNDSITINVKIISNGLTNGRHTTALIVRTNDPLNPYDTIPVVVDVAGTAEATVVQSSCSQFTGILQGATAADSVMVTNTGCDSLHITGFNGNTTEFSIAGLPVSLAPGDSIPVMVNFTPLTVGTFTDTLTLLNNDTAVTICATGTSVGAAVLSASADTMKVTLNKCKIIKNETYRIGNTGLGPLTYSLSIGDYSNTSQIAYNTVGATTNHIFNGVPSSDTLMIRVILKGDFDDYYERAYLRIDNYGYSYVYDNDKASHTLDTVEFLIWGTNVLNWTSDGTLDIELQNQSGVDGSAGSFHRIEVFLPAQINWASIVGTTSGTVATNGSVNKNLLFNAASLGVGTYHTTMKVSTNAPGTPLQNVPLQLNIVSMPEISLSDSCLYYPLTLVGDTSVREFTIYNDGCNALNVNSLTSSNNVFKFTPSSGTVAVGDSLKVTARFIPTQANFYNASLIITSNDSVQVMCLAGSGGKLPAAGFAINYENACLGEVAFVNSSSNNPTSYNWSMGDGTSYSTPSVTHFYARPGTYNVTLKVTNNAGKDSIAQTVTVNPLYVDFNMTNDTVLIASTVNFYDSSITATAWRWNFGDGTTSNTQNPVNTYNAIGKYQVSLEVDDANNCTRSITKDLYVVNYIGLEEELFSKLNYTVYPNPSNGKFTLESENADLTEITLVVSDLNGKTIWSNLGDSRNKTEIDLGKFSKGMYNLSLVRGGSTIVSKKLVVN